MSSTIKLKKKDNEIRVEWTTDIQSLTENMGIESESYCFPFSDENWHLRIVNHKKCIIAFLQKKNGDPPECVNVTFSFRLGNNDKEMIFSGDDNYPFSNNDGEVMALLMKRTYSQCSSDELTIICTMKSKPPTEASLGLRLSLEHVLRQRTGISHFGNMPSLKTRAYRAILKLQCPDLFHILDKKLWMGPARKHELELEDKNALQIILAYLHTGELEGLSSENVCRIYKIAHRYNMHELMELCTLFMEKNLSIDFVCDVIALAYFYEESELQEHAKKFFVKNESKIRETNSGAHFKLGNSDLSQKLLDFMMDDVSRERQFI